MDSLSISAPSTFWFPPAGPFWQEFRKPAFFFSRLFSLLSTVSTLQGASFLLRHPQSGSKYIPFLGIGDPPLSLHRAAPLRRGGPHAMSPRVFPMAGTARLLFEFQSLLLLAGLGACLFPSVRSGRALRNRRGEASPVERHPPPQATGSGPFPSLPSLSGTALMNQAFSFSPPSFPSLSRIASRL